MKNVKHWLRLLPAAIPVVPGILFLTFPGYSFTAFLCFALAMILLIYALFSLFPGRTSKVLRCVFSCLLAVGLVIAAGTEVYILSGSREDIETCDYVVVLGAGVNGSVPSLSLQERINGAFSYLQTHPETKAVLSGGKGGGEDITEAQCMYEALIKLGIAPERLLKEEKATTTAENLFYSLELLVETTGTRPRTLGIVSNEYHLCRAKLMAEDLGVIPVGIPAKTGWFSLRVNYYLREIAALWKYILFGGY